MKEVIQHYYKMSKMTFIDLNIDCTTFVKSFKTNFHPIIKLSIHLLREKKPPNFG